MSIEVAFYTPVLTAFDVTRLHDTNVVTSALIFCSSALLLFCSSALQLILISIDDSAV